MAYAQNNRFAKKQYGIKLYTKCNLDIDFYIM